MNNLSDNEFAPFKKKLKSATPSRPAHTTKMSSQDIAYKYWNDAEEENRRFQVRLDAAMEYVTSALGINAWSRNLDEHVFANAFCMPAELYENEEQRSDLYRFIARVFACHFISLSFSEWRESSDHPEWSHGSRYEVDWVGSRRRCVEIAHHLYLEYAPVLVGNRMPSDPEGKPDGLPTWTVTTTEPTNYKVCIVSEIKK